MPLTRVRTALIISGQATLRTRNLFERYRTLVDPRQRDSLLNASPDGWSLVEAAMAHTAACDALGMSEREAFDSGAAASEHVNGFVLDTMAQLAVGMGASPWTVLGVYGRLFRRVFDGGGFTVDRPLETEARVELYDMPMCAFSYFRDSYRGAHDAALRRFSSRLLVDEIPGTAHADGFAMRIAWH